jgi:glutathione S-transferase
MTRSINSAFQLGQTSITRPSNGCISKCQAKDPTTAKHGISRLSIILTVFRWFKLIQEPKIPVAIDRYINEIRRVSGVLDGVLAGRKYLQGDKCTYADLSFITWQRSILKIIEYDQAKDFPNLQAWIDRMSERPIIKAALKEGDEKMAAKLAAQGK